MSYDAERTHVLATSGEAEAPVDFSSAWLMVIDMQRAFSEAESRWGMNTYGAVRSRVQQLVPHFGERILFTRFVPPAEHSGSWVEYYKRWPEFTAAATTSATISPWSFDMGVPNQEAKYVVSAPTFSKWVPEQLPRALLEARHIVLTGVAYECCVLATALAAIDDGCLVHIVADGVGAGNEKLAQATSTILEARSPQVRFTDVPSLVRYMQDLPASKTQPLQQSAKE